MWRKLRILVLLLALAIAAYGNWYDRLSTTDWDETLWIGVFPINADGGEAGANYLASLTTDKLADIERFINTEAHGYGTELDRPVRVDLYPEVHEQPPSRPLDAGVLSTI